MLKDHGILCNLLRCYLCLINESSVASVLLFFRCQSVLPNTSHDFSWSFTVVALCLWRYTICSSNILDCLALTIGILFPFCLQWLYSATSYALHPPVLLSVDKFEMLAWIIQPLKPYAEVDIVQTGLVPVVELHFLLQCDDPDALTEYLVWRSYYKSDTWLCNSIRQEMWSIL